MREGSSRLLIDEPPLQVLPSLARRVGLMEAIFLQQVHYWLNPKHNKNIFEGRLWVYNTYEEWNDQLAFCSVKTVRRVISNLEEQGLLLTFITKDFKKTKYYTIDYEKLNALLHPPSSFFKEGTSSFVDAALSVEDVSSLREDNSLSDIPSLKTPEIQGSHRCGQLDQIDLPKRADGEVLDLSKKTTHLFSDSCKTPEIQGSHRCGQVDPIDLPKRADRSGQNDPIDRVKMTRRYNKDTEITLQRFPLPLENGHEEEEDSSSFEVKDLVQVWNEKVQSKLGRGPIHLTPLRAQKLQRLFSELFDQDSHQWQAYCEKIAQCQFLMGKSPSGFKVSFDWALEVNNACKVLEGAIYDKAALPQENSQKSLRTFLEELQEQAQEVCPSHPDPWFEICKTMMRLHGSEFVRSWLWQLKVTPLKEKVILTFPSTFKKDWVSTHHFYSLQQIFSKVWPDVKEITFEVNPSLFKEEVA